MFKRSNFCHVASNNRNNTKAGLFVYRTTDDLATVTTSGYFNDMIIDINLHDIIIHEQIDASDNTNISINRLCVTGKTLDNITVSAVDSGESYTAGDGVIIEDGEISVDIVTSVDSSSTDEQMPSAKLFYDTCGDIESLINAL